MDYVVKIKGDFSEFSKDIGKIGGELKQLEDNEVIVKLRYNENIKDYNKMLRKLADKHPEIDVQFQYNANEKLLKTEMNRLNELSKIDLEIDNYTFRQNTNKMAKDIKKMFDEGFSEKDIRKKTRELFQYISTASTAGFSIGDKTLDPLDDIIDHFSSVRGMFLDLKDDISSFSLIGPSENINEVLDKTRRNVEELQAIMHQLELDGARPTKGNQSKEIQELRDEIKIIKSDIDDINQRMEQLSGEAFSKASDEARDLNEQLEEMIGNLDQLERKGYQDLLSRIVRSFEDGDVKKGAVKAFFDSFKGGFDSLDDSAKELLKTLGLVDEQSGGLKVITDGANNFGGLVGSDRVALVRSKENDNAYENALKLRDAYEKIEKAGINCAKVIDVIEDETTGLFLEIQNTAKGTPMQDENLLFNESTLEASDEQVRKLISDLKTLYDLGIEADLQNPSNLLFSKENGFQIIDLDTMRHDYNSFEEMMDDFIENLRYMNYIMTDSGEEDTNPALTSKLNSFADKIEDIIPEVENAGKRLAEAVEDTIRDTQDSHSPSKVGEQLGQDWGEGYAKGIEESVPEVVNAAEKLAEAATNSVEELLQKFDEPLIDNLNSAAEDLISNEDMHKIEEFEEKLGDLLRHLGGHTWSFSPERSEELSDFMEEIAKFFDIDPKNKDILYAIFKPLLEFKNLNYEETIKEIYELRDAFESFSMVDNNEISRLVQNIKDAVPDDPDWLIDGDKIQKDLKEAWGKLGDVLGLNDSELSELANKNFITQFYSSELSALMIQKEALKMKANKTVDNEDVVNIEREVQAEKELVEIEEELSEVRKSSNNVDVVDRKNIDQLEKQNQAELDLIETNEKLIESARQPKQNTQDLTDYIDYLEKADEAEKEFLEATEKVADASKESKVTDDVKSEADALDPLKKSLQEVIELIDKKTEGFLDEETLVKSSVENEADTVNSLMGQLELIKGVLEEISGLTKGSHNGLGQGLKNLLDIVSGKDFGKNKDTLYEFKDALKELRDELANMKLPEDNFINQLNQMMSDKGALKNMADIVRNFKNAEKAMGQASGGQSASTDSKQVQNMVDSITSKISGYKNFKNKVLTQGEGLPGIKEVEAELDRIIAKLEDAKATVNDTNIDTIRHSVKGLVNDFNKAKTSYDNITKTDDVVKNSTVQAELNKLNQFIQKNTSASREWKDQLEECRNELKRMAEQATTLSSEFEPVKAQIQKIEAAMREAGETGISMWDRMRRSLKSQIAQQAAMYLSLQDFIRYARELVQTVTEVDTALTELRKVSDASDSRLAMSFSKSAETAKELGATISNVISSTSDWARMGYNIDQAEELARVTTLYQNVGDNIDQQTASQNLISALQGFQLDAEESESIIDKFNEVANNYAIDAQGIGEALKRSAASFNAANTDISKSIALVTATNTVLQDPSSVGTLWKTMSARIRGAKTELAELNEEEDEFTNSTSKLRNLIKGVTGFDIMKDENTFKDIYEIIIGIGEKWSSITDVERASIGEALAGIFLPECTVMCIEEYI